MIVEERTYHVTTGKLPELVRLYETEGTAIQQRILGHLVGAFTVDVGEVSSIVQLWAYDGYGERERRRAELQADEGWRAFLGKIQPLIHTQWNRILVPTAFSPLR
ncbi:MAG: NIPSNAP family protein [Actinobacteria bacterium]|nr:NIPSNAP family protein [Actinomycetota bacterium]